MKKGFVITGIRLNKAYNNLAAGYYPFINWEGNEDFYSNFFGKNITIQAIVGKNGCGKSSIFELIIKLINNLAFYIFEILSINKQLKLKLAENLNAELTFTQMGGNGCIFSDNKTVGFEYKNTKYIFEETKDTKETKGTKENKYTVLRYFIKQEELKKEEINNVLRLILNNCFYSIIIDYCIHSFISSRYIQFQQNNEDGEKNSTAWINSIFHKNDGYTTPILITPNRSNASINLDHENYLNQVRIVSLLKYAQLHNLDFIDNYTFEYINYKFNANKVCNKFFDKNSAESKENQWNGIVKSFISQLQQSNSIASIIVKHFFGEEIQIENIDKYQQISLIYLVYKVIHIATTYPAYSKKFSILGKYKYVFFKIDQIIKKEASLLNTLLQRLDGDKSHITLKLRQTINFLNSYNNGIDLNFTDFSLKEYWVKTKQSESVKSLPIGTISELLPPSYFTPKIVFKKTKKQSEVRMSGLSSGEFQMLLTLSTIVYHVVNLISVQRGKRNRPKYKNINIMIDEVEMCLHPEYQRIFLNRLISILNGMGLTKDCHFNIIVATHSPFMLSDIPQANILYLSDGTVANDKITINPFAANVNDILHQSFFLENGFSGEYAKRKIISLTSWLKDGKDDDFHWESNEKYIIPTIREVGDELLRQQLWQLYLERFNKLQNLTEIDRAIDQLKSFKKVKEGKK